MDLKALTEKIRSLVAAGSTDQAITALADWAREQQRDDLIDTAVRLRASWVNLNESRSRLTEEQQRIRLEQIHYDLLQALPRSEGTLLHPDLSYTCDRRPHYRAFQEALEQPAVGRVQFFYLFGGDLHLHTGMIRRIALELEGSSLQFLNPQLNRSCRVKVLEIPFDGYEPFEDYQTELLRLLFAAFGVQPNQIGPLRERRLPDLLRLSPLLNGLGPNDYLTVFISINDYSWHPELTPALAQWFMETFCGESPAATHPRFLFFFGVAYANDDETLAAEVRARVDDNPRIAALPELNPVERKDIERWLSQYTLLMDDPRKRREWIQQNFAAPQHYMVDVQEALEALIKQFNHPQSKP